MEGKQLKPMNKIIIGLVGEISAGKDTMADYLAKHHSAETVSFSQPLRDILDRLYLPQTRKNLANCGIALRGAFGQDLLSKTIAEEVRHSKAEIVVLPNVRLESDLIYLAQEPGFVLVAINVEQKIRFTRLQNRQQNADDAGKTWEQFLQDSQLPTEIHIRELAQRATYQIDNNGEKEELFKQAEQLIKQLRKE